MESGYRTKWENYDIQLRKRMPEFPFSNIWMAQQLHSMIPAGSIVHPAILSSLSSWDYFPLPKDVRSSANVGGFGIDGCTSALIGASLSSHELCFCITGDLAFFYDMNSLGCREIGPNLRILLINNGLGMTFKLSNHVGSQIGPSANIFIAAEGHNAAAKSVTGTNRQLALGLNHLGLNILAHLQKKNSMRLRIFLLQRIRKPRFCLSALLTKKMRGPHETLLILSIAELIRRRSLRKR